MTNRTLHENPQPDAVDRPEPQEREEVTKPDNPVLLSTIWIAVLFADVLRGVHETLRPGFVQELAVDGTVYGNEVTNATLLVSGVILTFICAVVVLARILPRQANRIVNALAAVFMISGVLAIWPKDPDDYVFGAFQIAGALWVLVIASRWNDRDDAETVDR